jgi:hypothetical protein
MSSAEIVVTDRNRHHADRSRRQRLVAIERDRSTQCVRGASGAARAPRQIFDKLRAIERGERGKACVLRVALRTRLACALRAVNRA